MVQCGTSIAKYLFNTNIPILPCTYFISGSTTKGYLQAK